MGALMDDNSPAHGREAARVFRVDRKFGRYTLLVGAACTLFFGGILVWIMLDLRPWEGIPDDSLWVIPGFGFFLLLGAYMLYFALHQAPRHAVCINDEGIWLSGRPDDLGFVRWDEIRRIRERPILQRLELIDTRGESRLRVEYQIEKFEQFAPELMERTRPYRDLVPLHTTHSMRKFAHGFGAFCLVVAVVAWLRWGEGTLQTDWVFWLWAGGAFYMLLATPIRFRITPDALETQLFLRTIRNKRDDIDAFKFRCEMANHQRHLCIDPMQNGRSKGPTIRLLQTSILEVHEALEEWLQQEPGTEEGV